MSLEEDLIEIARSKLQEHILASYDQEDFPGLRIVVAAAMRRAATEKVTSYHEDEELKAELVEEVCSESMDELLLMAVRQ